MKDILYRYFLQDGDVAFSQVPVRYNDDDKIFVPNSEDSISDVEESDILFWGLPVSQDRQNTRSYIEGTRNQLRLTNKEFQDLMEIDEIELVDPSMIVDAVLAVMVRYINTKVGGLDNIVSIRENVNTFSLDLADGTSYMVSFIHGRPVKKRHEKD